VKLLLDTHALIWWGGEKERLGRDALREIDSETNERFVSAVSAMEISTKFRLGKLPEAFVLAKAFADETAAAGFQHLSVTVQHAQVAGNLAIPNKDPFDRLLIAQAMIEGMALISNEAAFDRFGVIRVW
jgi:PIN domain nuclease of toxin-antitoxin system